MTSAVVDIFLTYQFVKRLVTPFDKWPAYKLGIIDKDGNILKKRKELRSVAEKSQWRLFDVMTLNLKKLLAKLPGGQTRIATYAAALFLLKEQDQGIKLETLEEDFLEFYQNNKQQILEEAGVEEDAPATSTAGIAGLGADDLKVSPKQARKYKVRNARKANNVTTTVKGMRRMLGQ